MDLSNRVCCEALEGRRLFAVASLTRNSFLSFLAQADANGDQIVASAEAKTQVGRIKSELAVAKADQAAAIREAKSSFNFTIGELKSQLRDDLAGTSGGEDRASVKQEFNSAVADAKGTLKEELADATSTFKSARTTLLPAQTVFNTLSSLLKKPFVTDTDNNGGLTLSNDEVTRLASRDGNAVTLTAKDLAGVNRIPKVR